MPSPLERTFRRFLGAMVLRNSGAIPEPVWESLEDHLARTDGTGATLCFHGPLREQVLDMTLAWLATTQQPPHSHGEQLCLTL